MRPKISSKLNNIILGVMYEVRNKYKNNSRYNTIMTGLKSASKLLTEITLEEIKNFKINE